jgi:hypothetical protein
MNLTPFAFFQSHWAAYIRIRRHVYYLYIPFVYLTTSNSMQVILFWGNRRSTILYIHSICQPLIKDINESLLYIYQYGHVLVWWLLLVFTPFPKIYPPVSDYIQNKCVCVWWVIWTYRDSYDHNIVLICLTSNVKLDDSLKEYIDI